MYAVRPSVFVAFLLCAMLVGTGCESRRQQQAEAPRGVATQRVQAAPDAEETPGEDEAPEASDPADATTPANASSIASFAPSRVVVSFDYAHASTPASNQMAIWVEDAGGALVRTVLVTDFTAAYRGYAYRPESLPEWVSKARPDTMGDDELDLVSSATPYEGSLAYAWDLADDSGARVADSTYKVVLETTLFWGSSVRYEATVDLANASAGDLDVAEMRSEPEEATNEDMVTNVRMTVD